MRAISVELRCVGGARAAREGIADVLARQGVTVPRAETVATVGPVLLLFDQVDEEVRRAVREQSGQGARRVIAVAAKGEELDNRDTWSLMEAGAADVLVWEKQAPPATTIAARLKRYAEIDELMESPLVRDNLVGRSRAWLRTLRQVVEVARFTDASVLLTGESGTGKELVARLIHSLDGRDPKGKLVVLDCATVVPELSGSEFFGHERGAFTHAVATRDGAFALAEGGTLFLDEVGELPLTLQAELLRVVQERTYKRVGSNTWRQLNFRLVCATNRDLLSEEAQGRFRRDLYFRLASWTCTLPPLRDRREDVLPLARHFLEQVLDRECAPEFSPAVREYLLTRPYLGNVRELRQLVHRLAKRHVGDGSITVGDLPEEERQPACQDMREDWRNGDLHQAIRKALAQGVGLKELTTQTADTAIQIALEDEEGSVRRAAQKLRITDRALQMRRATSQRRETGDEAEEPAEHPRFEPVEPATPERPPAYPEQDRAR